MELGNREQVPDLKEMWRKRARQWLGMEEGETRPRKRHRTKAFEVLNATDNILKRVGGMEEGWLALRISEEAQAGDPVSWPLVHWDSDHGSEIVSAISYLQYGLRLNLIPTFDPPHGCHDDFTNTLRVSGNWCYSLLIMVAWNLLYAPFDSGARHVAAQGAMAEYMQAHDSGDCPLWQAYLGQVLADQGETDRRFDENISADMWKRFCDSPIHSRRGRKVGMTRLMGMVIAAKDNMPDWTFQLLKWLYYGLQCGILSQGRFQIISEKRAEIFGGSGAPQADGEPAAHDSMAVQDRTTVNRMRSVCKNGLETAVMMYVDADNRQRMKMIEIFGGALQLFFSDCSRQCRSVDTAAQWVLRMVSGGYFVHLLKTCKLLEDEASLSSMGVVSELDSKEVGLEHPMLIEQDDYAASIGACCFALVRVRLVRMVREIRGWSWRFVIFGSTSPHDQQRAHMQQFRQDYLNYKTVAEMTNKTARSMLDRSLFLTTPMKQVTAILEASECTAPLPTDSTAFFDRFSRSLWTSLLCEDSFQRLRLREGGHRGGNKSISALHTWSTMVEKKVASSGRAAGSQGPRQASVPAAVGRQHPPPPPQLREIVGRTQKTSWFSPSAANMAKPISDLAFLSILADKNDWEKIGSGWLSHLVDGGRLMLRRRGEEQWFFSMGCVGDNIFVAWPADAVRFGGEVYYKPASSVKCVPSDPTGLHLMSLHTPFSWEAMTFKWSSPCRRHAVVEGVGAGLRAPGLLVSASPPAELLVVAARHAFWRLTSPVLTELAAWLAIPLPRGASLFNIIWLLIEGILPEPSPLDILEILRRRFVAMENEISEEVMAVAEAAEVLDKEDRRALLDSKRQEVSKKDCMMNFRRAYVAKRREVAH